MIVCWRRASIYFATVLLGEVALHLVWRIDDILAMFGAGEVLGG
jgi:hypothetical protein